MKKVLLGLLLMISSIVATAEDYSEGRNKNDSFFFNLKVMQAIQQKNPYQVKNDTYMELEFGGRKGVLDIYGYIDFLDLLGSTRSDGNGGDNYFAEIKPRLSIDGMTGLDLAVGPFKEWYIAGWMKVGDNFYDKDGNGAGLWHNGIGIGTDLELPWFGKTGLNLLATYKKEDYSSRAQGKWDGYSLQWDWFKPFFFFENGTFISYQGYVTYDFGADEINKDPGRTRDSFQWYNGLFWHTDDFHVGYGLKIYNDMANYTNHSNDGIDGFYQRTSGVGHYFEVAYKF